MFLVGPGHEARDVDERYDRDIETVARPDKARPLFGRVDIEDPGQHLRLVGHHPDHPAANATEAANKVRGPEVVVLEEVAPVQDGPDQVLHIVGLVRGSRDQVSQFRRQLHGVDAIVGQRGLFQVVGGEISEQLAHPVET